MCGILGYISNSTLQEDKIKKVLNILRLRGPDSQNFKSFNIFDRKIYFFHSRLNIIDLHKRSNQPYRYKNLTMIFNGEIYNYIELKKELKDLGYSFQTKSDTEVLIKYYYHFKESAFTKINGMWSLAIYDKNNNNLILSRDCFGEKPLFIYKNKSELIFGSEISYIKKISNYQLKVNYNKINQNLFFGFKALNYDQSTFFENIFKIEPATITTIDLDKFTWKSIKISMKTEIKIDENHNYLKNLENIFRDALSIRLRSDVPIGFCLSGGIDSSLLVAMSQSILNKKVNTFSLIDSDKRYNEIENINLIQKFLRCNHNFVHVRKKNFLQDVIDLTHYSNSPILTISNFMNSLLMKSMSKNKIKVSISGVGADELFTGYYQHYPIFLNEINRKKNFSENYLKWDQDITRYIRDKNLKNINYFNAFDMGIKLFYETEKLKKFFKKSIIFSKELKIKKYFRNKLKNRMENELFHEIVPPILYHDDLNAMKYSIENRSPYLDKNLYLFARKIPNNKLICGNYQKLPLRMLAKKYLPEKIYSDQKKVGFNSSINTAINLNSKKTLDYIFKDKNNYIFEIINRNELKKIFTKKNLPNYLSKFVFSVITTKSFLDQN